MRDKFSMIEHEKNSLSKSVASQIRKPTIDMTVEYGELVIDEYIKDDLASKIPFLKTIKAAYDIGSSIKDAFFLKKLMTFLREYHSNQISSEKVQEFNNKFDNDSEYKNKVVEHIIVQIDRLETLLKSKVVANLFRAHTQGLYNWDHFTYLSYSLEKLHPAVIEYLIQIPGFNYKPQNYEPNFTIGRHIGGEINDKNFKKLGLNIETILLSSGLFSEVNPSSNASTILYVTWTGVELYKYGISGLANKTMVS